MFVIWLFSVDTVISIHPRWDIFLQIFNSPWQQNYWSDPK